MIINDVRVRSCIACFAVVFLCIHTRAAHAQTPGAGDVVLRPGTVATMAGQWTRLADPAAAGGTALWFRNAGAAKVLSPEPQPSSFFEVTFDADAGIPYRVWLRLRAENNDWANDSVFVQFSGSVDAASSPLYRIGTTSAAEVNLEDCKGCGIAGWGWQDNGWGVNVLGPAIYFATTGPQVLRVQSREDGAIVDQILLSPSKFMSAAPGALKNDTTIFPAAGAPGPAVTLARAPYLQQTGESMATIVWATREPGPAEVRYSASGTEVSSAAATSRLVPAATTGFSFDYYQHEARLTGLMPAAIYTYDPFVSGVDVTPDTGSFRTAPPRGSGSVTFIAFGDSGTNSAPQHQLASLMSADTFDIALHTGDITYGTTTGIGDASYRGYEDWFFAVYRGWLPSHPFFSAEGNHDSRPSNDNGAAYLDMFSLPDNGASPQYPDHAERYYSFDYGPVHFIALDTEFTFQNLSRRPEQIAWLEADLAATTQPWKIAYFHRSPYSAGGEHGSDLAVRATFGPLFERHGVQLVISSHEHDYERTHPIRESSSGSPVTYVVTGGGGGPLYPAGSAPWTAYSASRHHYVRASADECTLRLDAIGLDGAAFDSATLDRCTAPPPPPPPPPPAASGEIVLYAAEADISGTAWGVVDDASAASGRRLHDPDAGAAKLTAALPSPASYFELTFDAEAGIPHRLWLRGKADRNYWANDSVFVQFSGSVTSAGAATYRIGTSSAAEVNLENCAGCGVSGWGWQDNGYGAGVLGPVIYFQTTGPQRLRVQRREDGFSIDQLVLSAGRYLTQSPGALKNDTTIVIRP
jgi:hypothetical protein